MKIAVGMLLVSALFGLDLFVTGGGLRLLRYHWPQRYTSLGVWSFLLAAYLMFLGLSSLLCLLLPAQLLKGLDSDNPYVRAWSIQFACERGRPGDKIVAKLAELAKSDSSQVVRFYVASAALRLPVADRTALILGLIICLVINATRVGFSTTVNRACG